MSCQILNHMESMFPFVQGHKQFLDLRMLNSPRDLLAHITSCSSVTLILVHNRLQPRLSAAISKHYYGQEILHQCLDPGNQEIRLVKPCPSKSSLANHLETIHLNLRVAPCYYALSYAYGAPFSSLPNEWENPDATHTI